ncbi:exodeoxyribonuclease III [Stappia taiwanensis]|uniref:Exodeoxyribonuclease III n=1 Tax=Stappia taiwanensis TaxID=992267 RepID=A0A838XN21_9HYPH|nr:exodeoxyribonuclease III [Stappia taiwanensis]MBA4611562.1 exodeoxyribonuclease III [Stappia taiwanensis]GGE99290.1 exodeoxyribonuclease III [Stappia taiwanensis]
MTDSLTIATWNINSVRLRLPIVEKFLLEYAPDVLCLQETKCPDGNFPLAALRKLGFEHIAINGQKGYNGVATLSRRPFLAEERRGFCDKGDSRHVATDIPFAGDKLSLHNFYVPAGGDEPNPEVNDKFAHKLAFLDEMGDWFASFSSPSVVVGDLNIAPYEQDVWSHKALLKVVSHTPGECDKLEAVREAGNFQDIMRRFVPVEEKLYTWWSYRARDWSAADKGRRLDHIWATPDLAATATGMEVLREARGWEKPSDHAPVLMHLKA